MSDIKNIIERNEHRKQLIDAGSADNSKGLVEQIYELKEINRHMPADFDSLITTIESQALEIKSITSVESMMSAQLVEKDTLIESQKEEIESLKQSKLDVEHNRKLLSDENQSLKGISELALQFYADELTYDIGHLDKHGFIVIDQDGGCIAREALSEIKKLTLELSDNTGGLKPLSMQDGDE